MMGSGYMDISGRMLTSVALLFLFSSALVRYILGPAVGLVFYLIIILYLVLIKQIREKAHLKHKTIILISLVLIYNIGLSLFMYFVAHMPISYVLMYFVIFLGIYYDLSFVDYSSYYRVHYLKRRIYRVFTIVLIISFLTTAEAWQIPSRPDCKRMFFYSGSPCLLRGGQQPFFHALHCYESRFQQPH